MLAFLLPLLPPTPPKKRSKIAQHVAADPTPLKPRLNPIGSDSPTHGHRVQHGACYRWHPGTGKLNRVPGRWAQNSNGNMSTKHYDGVWNRLWFRDVLKILKDEEYIGWRILKMTKCQFWEMEWIIPFCSCLRLIQYINSNNLHVDTLKQQKNHGPKEHCHLRRCNPQKRYMIHSSSFFQLPFVSDSFWGQFQTAPPWATTMYHQRQGWRAELHRFSFQLSNYVR